jgi:hypothetical protein
MLKMDAWVFGSDGSFMVAHVATKSSIKPGFTSE